MYVCLCKGITTQDVAEAAASGIDSSAELIDLFGWNDDMCCGRCSMEAPLIVLDLMGSYTPMSNTPQHEAVAQHSDHRIQT